MGTNKFFVYITKHKNNYYAIGIDLTLCISLFQTVRMTKIDKYIIFFTIYKLIMFKYIKH